MVALGVAALWAGYYLTMYGYCLIRGYDVPFTALMHTAWPTAPEGLGAKTFQTVQGSVLWGRSCSRGRWASPS